MDHWLRKIANALSEFTLFTRWATLSFSALLPLLGAATTKTNLANYQLGSLVGVALAFHIFAYVLNDVVDLPLDRTQPLRAHYPLVKGTIHPRQALVVAFTQIPLAFGLSYWIQASPTAFVLLSIAFGCMTIYNLWGKRMAFPPVAECFQGIGWGSLALYGAILYSDHLSMLTSLLFFFIVTYILLINGIHGGLRDLANDQRQGMHTTAILLGARSAQNGGAILSSGIYLYALFLQTILGGLLFLPLIYNWFHYEWPLWPFILGLLSIFFLISLILLSLALVFTANYSRLVFLGTWHIVALLNCLLLLFIPSLPPPLLTTTLLVYTVPLCSLSLIRDWLHKQIEEWVRAHIKH